MPTKNSVHIRTLLFALAAILAVASTTETADAASVARRQVSHANRLPVLLQKQSPAPLPTLAQPAPEKWPGSSAKINYLHRDATGLVTLIWTMTYNGESDDFSVPEEMISAYSYNGGYISAITLIDQASKTRYNPLRADPSELCICSYGATVPRTLNRGQSATFYEVFKLPQNVTSATVDIPGYSPADNIPIR